MAKELIVSKIMISLIENEFSSGLVLYKVKEDGILGKEQKSLSIQNMQFSLLNMATIIETIIEKTKEQEGIDV